MIFSLALLAILTRKINAQHINVPNGRVMLAAWLDSQDPIPNDPRTFHTGTRPFAFQQTFRVNLTAYQYAQNMPWGVHSPDYQIDQLGALNADTILYLSVYPQVSPRAGEWLISDEAIANLTNQCADHNRRGRKVMIRFAPEMNGYWMDFGNSPTRLIPLWRRLYNSLKASAPLTDMIWAPNAGNGWPWGVTRERLLPEDFALMDTNGNGVLDYQDDPYSPFYPGDEYVDWVGASNYHFGTNSPYYENTLPWLGEFETNMNAAGLYETYARVKNKPFMIAETGAAWHPLLPPGPGELPIKQAWWRQTITNATFLDTYPQCFKNLIEIKRYEGDDGNDLRDFRIHYKPEILNAFLADLEGVKSRYVFSNYTPPLVVRQNDAGDSGNMKKNVATSVFSVVNAILSVSLATMFILIN